MIERYGNSTKTCKQSESAYKQCGTKHTTTSKNQCEKQLQCFHCHSETHIVLHKECPEYVRNQLIKESMVFKNMTFYEANEEFLRTESCYRIAEKQAEFPDLQYRQRKRNIEERKEEKKETKLFKKKCSRSSKTI